MLTYIGIISLIILIIAIYQYKNNVIPEDNIEGFSYHNWSFKARNIPQNWQKNTAYLRVFADDYLHIYHNKGNKSSGITGKSPWKNTTWVGQARCCGKMYNFDIENFNPGDSLMFYSYNSGGPGYWGGYVFLNNKWFTFNRSTVRISAYQTQGDICRKIKYLGCYHGYEEDCLITVSLHHLKVVKILLIEEIIDILDYNMEVNVGLEQMVQEQNHTDVFMIIIVEINMPELEIGVGLRESKDGHNHMV